VATSDRRRSSGARFFPDAAEAKLVGHDETQTDRDAQTGKQADTKSARRSAAAMECRSRLLADGARGSNATLLLLRLLGTASLHLHHLRRASTAVSLTATV